MSSGDVSNGRKIKIGPWFVDNSMNWRLPMMEICFWVRMAMASLRCHIGTALAPCGLLHTVSAAVVVIDPLVRPTTKTLRNSSWVMETRKLTARMGSSRHFR